MGLEQESESPQEKAAKEFKISQKANGLFQKYQKLLLEKYDEDGEKVIGYNDKERKLSDEVRDFYYKDCKEIPKIRFEPGDDEHDDGEYEEDGLNAVKILPHNMALYKEVEYDYDRPVQSYRILEKQNAQEIIERGLNEITATINELDSLKSEIEKAKERLK